MASSESGVLVILGRVVSLGSLSNEDRQTLLTMTDAEAHVFVRCVFREWKNNPAAIGMLRTFLARVRASEYSLARWVEYLLTVYQWLEGHTRYALFTDIEQYVSCALEGSSLQCGHSMEWYLSQYGFERSQER